MYKLIFFVLILTGGALYFYGALEFDTQTDRLDISLDKEKAKELGESIKDKIEQ